MRTSLAPMLLPPTHNDVPLAKHWHASLLYRVYLTLGAIIADVALFVLLTGDPAIDQNALIQLALFNLCVLSGLAMLSLYWMRRDRAADEPMHALRYAIAIDAALLAVWTQAIGSLSSYLVLLGPLIVVVYRVYFGYRAALWFGLIAATLHSIVVFLESQGVLAAEALLIGSLSRVYELPIYRWLALGSLVALYITAFVLTNAILHHRHRVEHQVGGQQANRHLAPPIDNPISRARRADTGRYTGSVLNQRFMLGDVIGRGGMGEVYFGRQLDTQRDVAVKVLHEHLLEDPSVIKRFYREATAATRLPAHATASILDVAYDADAGIHFIAMEYLQGEDLGSFLQRQGRLTLAECISFSRQIAIALDIAHAAAIVHRDLKPQNIFLAVGPASGRSIPTDPTGHTTPSVRLLDFGLSMLLDAHLSITGTGAVIGTIGYLSPEQALGRRHDIGTASDRFAFAIIVYRMLTGVLPFPSEAPVAAVDELCYLTPKAPTALRPSLPAAIDRVMEKALAKTPHHRYDSATRFVEDLEAACATALPPRSTTSLPPSHDSLIEGDTLPLDPGYNPPSAADLARAMTATQH